MKSDCYSGLSYKFFSDFRSDIHNQCFLVSVRIPYIIMHTVFCLTIKTIEQWNSCETWLGRLISHYRPRAFLFIHLKIIAFIYTRLFENLKARILKGIVKWSVEGQQTAQSKKVYSN